MKHILELGCLIVCSCFIVHHQNGMHMAGPPRCKAATRASAMWAVSERQEEDEVVDVRAGVAWLEQVAESFEEMVGIVTGHIVTDAHAGGLGADGRLPSSDCS